MVDRPGLDVEVGVALTKMAQQLAKVEERMNRAARRSEEQWRRSNTQAAKTFDKIDERIEQSSARLTGLQSAIVGALSVRQIQQYADTWTVAGNKIAAAAELSGKAARDLSEINDIADETRSGIAETADLYAKLLRATKDVAESEREVAEATELVNKAFKAGGAAASEQAAGILQLAQGLSSGILQGDELRSLRENAPILAQAIADEFETTIGGLKDLGAAGELTADRVFGAILKAGPQIQAAFATTNSTIGEGFTRLRNALTEYIAAGDDTLQATDRIVKAMAFLADNLDAVAVAGTLLAGRVLGPMLAAAASRAALAISGVGAAATTSAAGIAALRGAVGLLGGPVGLLVTSMAALPLLLTDTDDRLARAEDASLQAGSALDAYARATARAAEEQEKLAGKVTAATQTILVQSRVQLQDALAELRTSLADLEGDLFGQGLFDRDDITAAIDQIATLQKFGDLAGNGFLSGVRQGLEEIRAGGGDIAGVLQEIERLSGAGREVAEVVRQFDGARLAPETVDLESARSALREMAELIGGFDRQLDAIDRADGPDDLTAAYDDLRDTLLDAAQAGEVLRSRLDGDLRQLFQSIGATRREIEIIEAALAGNRDEVLRLSQAFDPEAGLVDMVEEVEELNRLLEDARFDDQGELRDAAEEMAVKLEEAAKRASELGAEELSTLGSSVDTLVGKFDALLRQLGLVRGELESMPTLGSGDFEAEYVARAASGAGSRDEELVRATTAVARQLGVSARDLLTVMSFESAGTFDPAITNATGHTGLIQFSPANQKRYGVGPQSSITEQVIAAGRYLEDAGIKAGDGLLRIYAAILTGSPNNVTASDEHNGGTPGGALVKVRDQMDGHRARADGLLAAYGGTVRETDARLDEEERAARDSAAEAARMAKEEFDRETEARRRNIEVRREFIASAQEEAAQREFEATLIGKSAAEQARLITRQGLLNQLRREGIDVNEKIAGSEKTYGELVEETANRAAQAAAQQERLTEQAENAGAAQDFLNAQVRTLKDGLLDAIVEGRNFQEVLAGVAKALARAALEAALFGEGPLSGGGGGNLVGAVIGAITGRRAGGGGVRAGQPYLVNEHTGRSEVFVPSQSGAVLNVAQAQQALSAAAGGGGGSYTFAPVIDARGADAMAVARLEAQMRQMHAEFEGRVHVSMRNARNRRTDGSWR